MEDIIEIKDIKDLPYGENTSQKAGIAALENGVDFEIISRNKELKYIDYLNFSKALIICAEFFDVHAAAIINHNSVCSVALGASDYDTLEKLTQCDPLSIAESTIGFSKEVTKDAAKILKSMKVKNIIAPSFEKEAFSTLLDSDINLIAVKTPLHEVQGFYTTDIKVTPLGILVQEQNRNKLTKDSFQVVSQIKPSQQQAEDGIFAWKISKHLKTNSVIIAKDLCTRAIIQGQPDLSYCVERAMDTACENSKDGVLVIDSSIENQGIINAAIQGRIGLIVEAGDSKNSQNTIKTADKYGVSLIFTKIRNYKY